MGGGRLARSSSHTCTRKFTASWASRKRFCSRFRAALVRACAKLIEEEGAEQFLVNLLFVLRECWPESTDPE